MVLAIPPERELEEAPFRLGREVRAGGDLAGGLGGISRATPSRKDDTTLSSLLGYHA